MRSTIKYVYTCSNRYPPSILYSSPRCTWIHSTKNIKVKMLLQKPSCSFASASTKVHNMIRTHLDTQNMGEKNEGTKDWPTTAYRRGYIVTPIFFKASSFYYIVNNKVYQLHQSSIIILSPCLWNAGREVPKKVSCGHCLLCDTIWWQW